jgi:autotransporter-associated beta strand protein
MLIRPLRFALLLAIAAAGLIRPAAATIWDGTIDTDLSNAGNWSSGLPGSAEFSSAIAPDPTVGDLSPTDIFFTGTSKSYNVGGGTITISGSGNIDTFTSPQPQTFSNALLSVTVTNSLNRGIIAGSSVTGTGKLTINSTVFNFSSTGAGNIRAANGDIDITSTTFTATGGGTQTINAQNAARTITITPAINVGNNTNAAATSNITIAGAGTTRANGGFTGTGTQASLGGAVTKSGTGTLVLANSSTWDGNVSIADGTLEITDSSSLGAGGASAGRTNLTSSTLGTLALNPATSISTNESIQFTGRTAVSVPHILNKAGNNTVSGLFQMLAGTGVNVNLKTDAGTLTVSGTVDNNSTTSRSLNFQGVGNSFLSGTNNLLQSSTGRWNIQKRDSGKLTITGSQNYTGATTINDGQLEIQNSGSLGLGGVVANAWTAILFNPGTALVLSGAAPIVSDENIFLRGKATVDASIINTAGANNLTGRIETELQVVGSDNITFQADGGSLELSGILAQMLPTAKTLNLIGGASGKISGSITETTGLWNIAKDGAGTWEITNAQNYAGTTTVNNGVLLVNSTHSSAGVYTVNSGGTLGGDGLISAPVTVDGILSPGNSIDTLSIIGATTLNGSYLLETDLAGNSDQLSVSGLLALGGSSVLDLDVTSLLNPSLTYTVASYTSLSGVFSTVDSTILATHTVDYSTGNEIRLVPIPEPNALILLGLGFSCIAGWRRRNARN